MAIFDLLLAFATSQVITGGTTTQSEDIVDLDTVSRNIGTGEPLYVVIHILAKSGGDGSDTFVFALQDGATETAGVIQSPADKAVLPTITGIANIVVGSKLVIPVPPSLALRRYIGLRYAVTADAVLTVTAYLTNQKPADHAVYPDAI